MAFFFDSSGAEELASDLSSVERGMESRVFNPFAGLFATFPPRSRARNREIQTLLGAGSTTIHLLGWSGQLLADHPECQDLLREELDSLGSSLRFKRSKARLISKP